MSQLTVEVIQEGPLRVVEVLQEGPRGATGPAGGGVGTAYVHSQTTPATTWTINHNLGYRPSVELLNAGSQEIDGDVSHPSINQTVVILNPPSAGIARLI